jgi:hypothetical protein
MYSKRGQIYDKLSKSKSGQYMMLPVLIPYLIYGLIKLLRDDYFTMMMLEAKKQKKLDDYL